MPHVIISLLVVLKKKVYLMSVQDVGAAGVGNVGRSSALFTIILRRVLRLLLPEKPIIQSVVGKNSKSCNLSKKTIAQVVIIVIVIPDGNMAFVKKLTAFASK